MLAKSFFLTFYLAISYSFSFSRDRQISMVHRETEIFTESNSFPWSSSRFRKWKSFETIDRASGRLRRSPNDKHIDRLGPVVRRHFAEGRSQNNSQSTHRHIRYILQRIDPLCNIVQTWHTYMHTHAYRYTRLTNTDSSIYTYLSMEHGTRWHKDTCTSLDRLW